MEINRCNLCSTVCVGVYLGEEIQQEKGGGAVCVSGFSEGLQQPAG